MPDPAVNIKISTRAELSALRETERDLTKQIVAARTAGRAYADLERDLAKVQSRMASMGTAGRIRADLANAVGSIPGIGELMSSLSLGPISIAAAGIATAFAGAAASIKAFAAGEVEMAKLDAALANSGKMTDDYRGKLEALSQARSSATGIDDEKYISVFTTLTKFGADSGNIDNYTRAVENLAGFMGGDIEQASFLFGKAMQGSTEMLGRYGINVDKSKSQTEQLADIMTQLESKGGGQLEAMGNTLQGSFNKIGNAWENLLQSMGSAADKAGLKDWAVSLADRLQSMSERMGGSTTPNQQNRWEYAGTDPNQQKSADVLNGLRANLQKDSAKAEEDLKSATLRRNSGMLTVPEIAAAQSKINDARARLNAIKNELAKVEEEGKSLQRLSPEKATEQRKNFEQYGPEATPEQLASMSAAAQELPAKRDALELELKLAEATRTGNKEEAIKLKWLQDYNAAKAVAMQTAMSDPESFASRRANASLPPEADPKKVQTDALKDQLALEKEKGDTRIAAAKAAGKTELDISRIKLDNLHAEQTLRQQLADLEGKSAQEKAIAAEQGKQAEYEVAKSAAEAAKKAEEEKKSRLEQLATGPGSTTGIDARTGTSRKYGLGNVRRNMDGSIASATKDGRDLSPEDLALINGAEAPKSALTAQQAVASGQWPAQQAPAPGIAPQPSVPGVPSVPPLPLGEGLGEGGASLATSSADLSRTISDLAQSASNLADAASQLTAIPDSINTASDSLSGLGTAIKSATDNLQNQIDAITRSIA